jgi:hypothetical protein
MPRPKQPLKNVDTGEIYPSIKAAATATFISSGSFNWWLTKCRQNGENSFICSDVEFEILTQD